MRSSRSEVFGNISVLKVFEIYMENVRDMVSSQMKLQASNVIYFREAGRFICVQITSCVWWVKVNKFLAGMFQSFPKYLDGRDFLELHQGHFC